MADTILAGAVPEQPQGASAPQGADTKATPAPEAAAAPTTPAVTPPAAETQQGAEPDAKASQAKADVAPPAVEVKLPEGVEADPKLLEVLKGTAKDSKSAQALVDEFVAYQKRSEEAAAKAWEANREQLVKGWLEAAKADKEIGGANLESSIKAANAALEKFGDQELRQLLADSRLNNHPAMARFLVRVQKATGEDSLAGKTPSSNGRTSTGDFYADLGAQLYPDMPSRA